MITFELLDQALIYVDELHHYTEEMLDVRGFTFGSGVFS